MIHKDILSTKSSFPTNSSHDSIYRNVAQNLRQRANVKIWHKTNDVTPAVMDVSILKDEFVRLEKKIHVFINTSIDRKARKTMTEETVQRDTNDTAGRFSLATIKMSLDDIMQRISVTLVGEGFEWNQTEDPAPTGFARENKLSPFIKITLCVTDEIILYEQTSITVLKESEEAKLVEEDNKRYDYITLGKGKIRRKSDNEAQTNCLLYKSRTMNTNIISKLNLETFVSNYEMYDTFKQFEQYTKHFQINVNNIIAVTTYKVRGGFQFTEIRKKPNYRLAVTIIERILAGNVFESEMRAFRNMNLRNPLSQNIKYLYRLEKIWILSMQLSDGSNERRSLAWISWCPANGDIFATAHGVYAYLAPRTTKLGLVCIWNLKNPINPEKIYEYNVPVMTVEFSPFYPQLIAVGLYDGRVEVRDISRDAGPPLAMSQRTSSPSCEPITQFKWIPVSAEETLEVEPFLSVSQDGRVMKYRIVNSPFLVGFQQMKLDRVEGTAEGLLLRRSNEEVEANRSPQGLALGLHPTKTDLYFILTDEGCIHTCSLNYPHQHMELLQVHEGSVFSMEYSPWSPKLFLTCGSDWCVRIWVEGILKPLVTLTSGPNQVHCAYWSPTHSTIIVALTRHEIEVWDLKRTILNPVSKTELKKSYGTLARFSNCGKSIAVGDESGRLFLFHFEDMPFPSYFQYEELIESIYRVLSPNPELLKELKSLGHLGYPKSGKKNDKDRFAL